MGASEMVRAERDAVFGCDIDRIAMLCEQRCNQSVEQCFGASRKFARFCFLKRTFDHLFSLQFVRHQLLL